MNSFALILFFFMVLFLLYYLYTNSKNSNIFEKLSPNKFLEYLKNPKLLIVDTREIDVIKKKGFIKGTQILPVTMYENWSKDFIKPEDNIILIVEKGKEKEAYDINMKMNYKNIIGYFLIEELENEDSINLTQIEYNSNTKEEITKLVEDKQYLLDIREEKEYIETGVIKEAALIPESQLMNRYKEIPNDKDIYIYCRSGMRAVNAMSFLVMKGYENKMYIMEKGMLKVLQKQYPVVKYEK